jgi:hypothetical protein
MRDLAVCAVFAVALAACAEEPLCPCPSAAALQPAGEAEPPEIEKATGLSKKPVPKAFVERPSVEEIKKASAPNLPTPVKQPDFTIVCPEGPLTTTYLYDYQVVKPTNPPIADEWSLYVHHEYIRFEFDRSYTQKKSMQCEQNCAWLIECLYLDPTHGNTPYKRTLLVTQDRPATLCQSDANDRRTVNCWN